jgi:hypothetical protein
MKISQVRVEKTEDIQTMEELYDTIEYTFEFLPLLRVLGQEVLDVIDQGNHFIITVD